MKAQKAVAPRRINTPRVIGEAGNPGAIAA
jgi:hypothetical protein